MPHEVVRNWRMDHPHVTFAADAAIASAAVSLPVWAYQLSAWAGFITVMLGLIVMLLRAAIAFRDWKKTKIIEAAEDINVGN